MSSRKYYTLLVREKGERFWAIEFGDYDRECVKQEKDDLKYSATEPLEYKIVVSDDTQASINEAVAAVNAVTRRSIESC